MSMDREEGYELSTRILLVDDEPDLADIVKRLLEKYGYEVDIAYNAQEGIKKALQENPDIVLMDVLMPGISGIEAARKLKQEHKFEKPVVLFTVVDISELDEEASEVADAYIAKPFDIKVLVKKLEVLYTKTQNKF